MLLREAAVNWWTIVERRAALVREEESASRSRWLLLQYICSPIHHIVIINIIALWERRHVHCASRSRSVPIMIMVAVPPMVMVLLPLSSSQPLVREERSVSRGRWVPSQSPVWAKAGGRFYSNSFSNLSFCDPYSSIMIVNIRTEQSATTKHPSYLYPSSSSYESSWSSGASSLRLYKHRLFRPSLSQISSSKRLCTGVIILIWFDLRFF